MPVEIRELTIKTTITSDREEQQEAFDYKHLRFLKQQVVQECLKVLKAKTNKDNLNR